MKNRQRTIEIHLLKCLNCGNNFPIPRNCGKLRKKGHIKDIWCPFCKEVQKFEEIY